MTAHQLCGFPSTPIVPPTAVAHVELQVFPDIEGYAALSDAICNRVAFMVLIGYADASGQSAGAVRLDITPRKLPADSTDWLVQRVHWAGTPDAAVEQPSLSSAIVPD